MTHEEMSEMYELYAIGVLEPGEKEEIDEHLSRGCAACSAGLSRALAFNAIMGTFAEQVNPPRRLRSRVLASVGGRPGSLKWIPVWAAAAAALVIGLVIFSATTNNQLDNARGEIASVNAQRDSIRRQLEGSQAQLGKLQAALQFLNSPDTVQAAFGGTQTLPPRGRVFVNPSRGVLLIASNLSPVPAGQTYEMWVIPKKGNPTPAGLFQPDRQGNAINILNAPVDRAQTAAIAVTVEPASGSPQPTSKPFIVTPI